MDVRAAYHFLFETYQGIGVLFLAAIVICLVACVVMERSTRKRYRNHEAPPEDWDFENDEEHQGE